jgi:hypothetical protein
MCWRMAAMSCSSSMSQIASFVGPTARYERLAMSCPKRTSGVSSLSYSSSRRISWRCALIMARNLQSSAGVPPGRRGCRPLRCESGSPARVSRFEWPVSLHCTTATRRRNRDTPTERACRPSRTSDAGMDQATRSSHAVRHLAGRRRFEVAAELPDGFQQLFI